MTGPHHQRQQQQQGQVAVEAALEAGAGQQVRPPLTADTPLRLRAAACQAVCRVPPSVCPSTHSQLSLFVTVKPHLVEPTATATACMQGLRQHPHQQQQQRTAQDQAPAGSAGGAGGAQAGAGPPPLQPAASSNSSSSRQQSARQRQRQQEAVVAASLRLRSASTASSSPQTVMPSWRPWSRWGLNFFG